MNNQKLFNEDKAYAEALNFAQSHYENFPVISFFVPKDLRKHIAIIYWFARTADDFADEGKFSESERTEKLNQFEDRLNETLKGNYTDGFDFALHKTITEKKLSPNHFYALISAFKQDVFKKRYLNYKEVLDYCSRSANPVGRIILELYGIINDEANSYSDKICTGLQIANFYQDVKIDFAKNRIYIPQNEMEKFGVYEKQFELKQNNLKFKKLMRFQIERNKKLFSDGKPLLHYLQGKLKFQISWTILGGEKILEEIEKIDYDVLSIRPKLNKIDYFSLMLKSFFI